MDDKSKVRGEAWHEAGRTCCETKTVTGPMSAKKPIYKSVS
jgi:hypothetical protein